MRFKFTAFYIAILVAGILRMASASAETQTQVVEFSYTPTNAELGFTLNPFSPILGELNAVNLSLNGNFLNKLGFINFGSPANFSIDFSNQARLLNAVNTELFNSANLPASFSKTLAAGESFPSNFNIDAINISNSHALPPVPFSWSTNLTNIADLALFTGPGNLTLPLLANSSYIGQVSNGFGLVYGESQVRANLQLEYVYTPTALNPIPEPEISALFAAGLAFTALWLRRTRKYN